MKTLLTLLLLFAIVACSKTTPIPKKDRYPSLYADKKYLETIDFKGKEIVSVYKNNQFYYIRTDGKMMPTLTFDNGADEFSDGLARTKINGKIGFFNRNLEIVLKPIYDFAFPFHNGVAEICTGCKEKRDGDHTMLDGGEWKKIDRDGLVIE